TVTIHVQVTTPPGATKQTPPPAAPSEDLRLRWEVWNGTWVELGTSTRTGPAANTVPGFSDGTNALSQEGDVKFTLPPNVASFSLKGNCASGIPAGIAAANYGVEGLFAGKNPIPQPPAAPFDFILPTFQPPCIKSLAVTYDLDKPAPAEKPALPEPVLAENDFVFTDLTALNKDGTRSFAPFQPSHDSRPTLY